jgi:dTDP-4-amino-4,6-dideoxygalactose transaminase
MKVMEVDLQLGPELLPYLEEIQQAGIYTNFGPQVQALQRQYADLFGVNEDCVSSSNNATIALAGAMDILNAKSWLVPSWTFVATAHAAVAISNDVVFGDVDLSTWSLSADHYQSGRGAVVTAPFGSKIRIDEQWNDFSAIVVDAAAAIAAPPIISPKLNIPWVIVFSLHATKILGVGEGAILVFSSPELAKKFKSWTNFGFSGGRNSKTRGTNGKLSEIHGAIGRFRLSRWPEEHKQWQFARTLVHGAGDKLGINPPFSNPEWISPYWIVRLPSEAKKLEAKSRLETSGFETRDWWEGGCHTMPAFFDLPREDSLDKTNKLAQTSLGLPFGKSISKGEVSRIASVIETVL